MRSRAKVRAAPVVDHGAAQKKIEAALSGLASWIPDSTRGELISALAEKLACIGSPNFPAPPPASVTAAQLSDVKKHGSALLAALDALQGPAVDALRFRDHDGRAGAYAFRKSLRKLIDDATTALAVVAHTKDPSGPKSKPLPRAVAALTADYFFRLTGKRPARITNAAQSNAAGGEFIKLLYAVFTARGINASADRYGREAIRLWTQTHPRAGQ
jgi:hypothetical protein